MNVGLVGGVVVTLAVAVGCASMPQVSGSSGRAANGRTATSQAAKPAEPPSLTVRVVPLVILAPSDARGLVTVPRHAENRLARVILESVDYYSSSDIPLDGANAPQNHFLHWRHLPPGSYRVTLEVYGSNGLRASTHARGAGGS